MLKTAPTHHTMHHSGVVWAAKVVGTNTSSTMGPLSRRYTAAFPYSRALYKIEKLGTGDDD